MEFIETDTGDKKREGPRNEKEEAAAQDKWLVSGSASVGSWLPTLDTVQAKRETIAAKIRNDVTTKLHTLEGYAERLERKAGSGFRPSVNGQWVMSLVLLIS